jgi:hypothetical protein
MTTILADDASTVYTNYSKPGEPSVESTVLKATCSEVEDARNDEPATDGQKEREDVTITINGNTIVIVPEDQLRGMSAWVDSVNEYFQLKERDSTTVKLDSAREQLTANLTVMGTGVASKTVKISHDVAEYVVNAWKGQRALAREGAEKPESLKEKFNSFLESFKFDIPKSDDLDLSVVNIGTFNDDDSTMRARKDVEVILSDTFESAETTSEVE